MPSLRCPLGLGRIGTMSRTVTKKTLRNTLHRFAPRGRLIRLATLGCVALALAACGGAPVEPEIRDPHEERNRLVHSENVELDRALVRPASKTYGTILPEPVQDSVGHFASNLALPGMIVNNLLQGNLEGAGQNTARFLFNSVFGIGGIFDPASDAGLFPVDADFGQTLYVWGVPEGDYVVLPVIGPSTERHTVGRVVDLFTNPLTYVLPDGSGTAATVAGVGSRLSDRNRFSDTVDSIYYDSADSYTQTQLFYYQNRRFELGVEASAETDDVFEELYGN